MAVVKNSSFAGWAHEGNQEFSTSYKLDLYHTMINNNLLVIVR